MGDFNRSRFGGNRGGSRFGGGNRFGGGGFGGNRGGGFRDRSPKPQMFSAVCDNCGKDCEVPFRPTGEKPVYCKDCYQKMNGGEGNSRGFSDRPAFSERRYNNDDVYHRSDRPKTQVYRADDASAEAKNAEKAEKKDRNATKFAEFTEQLQALNSKLDAIITALGAQEKPTAKKTAAKKPTAKKTTTKKSASKKAAEAEIPAEAGVE